MKSCDSMLYALPTPLEQSVGAGDLPAPFCCLPEPAPKVPSSCCLSTSPHPSQSPGTWFSVLSGVSCHGLPSPPPPRHHHPELDFPLILESFRKLSLTPKSGLPGNSHRSVIPGELNPLTRLLSLTPASRNHDSSLMAKPRPQTPERRCYPAPPHPRAGGLAAAPGAQ